MRYTDEHLKKYGVDDFVIRERIPTIVQFGALFFATYSLILLTSYYAPNPFIFICTVFLIIGSLCWFIVVSVQRSRDLVLATEFQNALFASALGIHNKFCLIIKRDGTIVYLDRGFQSMFPEFSKIKRPAIDLVLDIGRVSREESEKIYSAINKGAFDKVMFSLRTPDGKVNKILMTIDPLVRPAGFLLLRGREFVERLPDEETSQEEASTISLHLLETLPVGIYIASPAGQIVHINRCLEEWLGYKPGEMSTSHMTLQQLVDNGGGETQAAPADFEGEIQLKRKNGTLLKTYIKQQMSRNGAGEITGCTAIVHNLLESPGLKKKLKS